MIRLKYLNHNLPSLCIIHVLSELAFRRLGVLIVIYSLEQKLFVKYIVLLFACRILFCVKI